MSLMCVSDEHEGAATEPESRRDADEIPGEPRRDESFLNTAACVIGSVYVATHSAAAGLVTALVAAVVALRRTRRR
jgi:hypothetical protein